jgi:hypothetical protein
MRKEHPMPQGRRHPMLEHLDALVGEWETESKHRFLPDTVVPGRSTIELLEGGHFPIWRVRNEHPDFPDSISVLGCEAPIGSDDSEDSEDSGGRCSLRYFDSRGDFRERALGAEAGVWRFWCAWPGFSQRFTGTLSADGVAVADVAELCEDGAAWDEDLRITYTRVWQATRRTFVRGHRGATTRSYLPIVAPCPWAITVQPPEQAPCTAPRPFSTGRCVTGTGFALGCADTPNHRCPLRDDGACIQCVCTRKARRAAALDRRRGAEGVGVGRCPTQEGAAIGKSPVPTPISKPLRSASGSCDSRAARRRTPHVAAGA